MGDVTSFDAVFNVGTAVRRIYSMDEPKVTCNVFANGRLGLTGAKPRPQPAVSPASHFPENAKDLFIIPLPEMICGPLCQIVFL